MGKVKQESSKTKRGSSSSSSKRRGRSAGPPDASLPFDPIKILQQQQKLHNKTVADAARILEKKKKKDGYVEHFFVISNIGRGSFTMRLREAEGPIAAMLLEGVDSSDFSRTMVNCKKPLFMLTLKLGAWASTEHRCKILTDRARGEQWITWTRQIMGWSEEKIKRLNFKDIIEFIPLRIRLRHCQMLADFGYNARVDDATGGASSKNPIDNNQHLTKETILAAAGIFEKDAGSYVQPPRVSISNESIELLDEIPNHLCAQGPSPLQSPPAELTQQREVPNHLNAQCPSPYQAPPTDPLEPYSTVITSGRPEIDPQGKKVLAPESYAEVMMGFAKRGYSGAELLDRMERYSIRGASTTSTPSPQQFPSEGGEAKSSEDGISSSSPPAMMSLAEAHRLSAVVLDALPLQGTLLRHVDTENTKAKAGTGCCLFFPRGMCKNKKRCKYLHRRVQVPTAGTRDEICTHFNKNNLFGAGCNQGNLCAWLHYVLPPL